MKSEYIITTDELEQKGLILADYVLDGAFIQPIINIALDLAITRILHFNDNFDYEEDIELAIDNNEKLIKPFKKLQWQIIYNLVFLGDTDPINFSVDNIICSDLRFGKINGFQKNLFQR